MALYINHTGKLKEVKEKPFKLEKDIQKVFEANLYDIMGLELVKSEFTIKNKRIDTLAYDTQASAFIIIEYKRDKNRECFLNSVQPAHPGASPRMGFAPNPAATCPQ